MLAATPASLEVFRQKFLGAIDNYMAWHDGYSSFTDFDCLDNLSPTDQQLAAAELLLALEKNTADPRAILGLGHLKYQPAISVLHTYLAIAPMYALEAIYRIDPARLNLQQVEELLQPTTSNAYVLQHLLIGLRQYYTRPQLSSLILQRVFELLVHPEYLVRYNALAAMRTFYDLTRRAADRASSRHIDVILSKISAGNRQADYRKAQRLLLAAMRSNGSL